MRLVFGDHPCIDGTAAMWVLQRGFQDRGTPADHILLLGMGYSNSAQHCSIIKEQVEKCGAQSHPLDIYFVDYVPNLNQLEVITWLLEQGHHVTILDHHLTSAINLKPIIESNIGNAAFRAVFDYHHSSAIVSWQAMFHGDNVPGILQLVEAMDLLKLKTIEEECAAAWIDTLTLGNDQTQNMQQFQQLYELYEQGGLAAMAARGREAWEATIARTQEVMSNCYTVTIADKAIPSVTLASLKDIGRVGVARLTSTLTSSEDPLLFLICQTAENQITVSVRVNPEQADKTAEFMNEISATAKAAARKRGVDEESVVAGGRGVKGEIGLGALRMPLEVAMEMGLVGEPYKNINLRPM